MFCKGTMKLNTQNQYLNLYNSQKTHKLRDIKNAQGDMRKQNAIKLQQNTISNRPAQAISFGGLFDTGFKLVEFVNDNEAAYNAIYSLLVAGILKPYAVMHMPGSEDKDKQMVATKNFLQAFIGAFLGLTIGGGVVKKAIDNIKNNLKLIVINEETKKLEVLPETSQKALEVAEDIIKKGKNSFVNKFHIAVKEASSADGFEKAKTFIKTLNKGIDYNPTLEEILDKSKEITKNVRDEHLKIFAKNPDFVEMLKSNVILKNKKTAIYDAYESFWKNSTGSLTAIGKAMIASALLPPVLNAMFGKRNKEKEETLKKKSTTLLLNTKQFTQEKANFKPFIKNDTNKKDMAFKGAIGKIGATAADILTSGVEKASISPVGELCARALSWFKKPSPRMADLESFMITGYWIQNTARSKKIEPSQKPGFILHTGLVTLVSSACALAIDWALDGLKDSREKKYKEKIEQIAKMAEDKFPELIKSNSNLFEKVNSKDAMDSIQLAQYEITKRLNECLADNQIRESLLAQRDSTIENIVKKLNNIEIIKNNNPATKELVERAVDNLAPARELQDGIKQIIEDNAKKFGTLFNEKGIIKELSKMFLSNNTTIEQNPKMLSDTVNKLATNYGKKISKFKSLTIFTLVVRFLVPVLMVPVSGRLKYKFVDFTSKIPFINNMFNNQKADDKK